MNFDKKYCYGEGTILGKGTLNLSGEKAEMCEKK